MNVSTLNVINVTIKLKGRVTYTNINNYEMKAYISYLAVTNVT